MTVIETNNEFSLFTLEHGFKIRSVSRIDRDDLFLRLTS